MADFEDIPGIIAGLKPPSDFTRYENLSFDVIKGLEDWRTRACKSLCILKESVASRTNPTSQRTAEIIAAVAVFDGEDEWINPTLRELSIGVLDYFPTPNDTILKDILTEHVKPLFSKNPHPLLNPTTGRILPRPAGGSMAMLDNYDDQVWKVHPGAGNLVAWCARHISDQSYELLWHLVIPPVMTLLDDYQAAYKLKGVNIVSDMLLRVPNMLLMRTGVDKLLITSLSTTLTHLHDEGTAALIRRAVPVMLRVIEAVTSPGSEERFEKHCHLLGENIIGGIWTYASRDSETIEASFDVLPSVIHALGIGSARYLKALVPQCLHPISPTPLTPRSPKVEMAALKALAAVIDECQPRIYIWKGSIIDGVVRRWVDTRDNPADYADIATISEGLRDVIQKLAHACRTASEIEFRRLLEVDQAMFEPLLGMHYHSQSK